MEANDDRALVKHQEAQLLLPSWDDNDAWALGVWLRARAANAQLPLVIDVRRFDRPLFYAALPGSTPDNLEWVRRKAKTVARFHRSSYGMGLDLASQGKTLAEKYDLDPAEYAAHGGAFPLSVKHAGVIGSVTVSGLPQRADHMLVVRALCAFLNRPVEEFELPPVR